MVWMGNRAAGGSGARSLIRRDYRACDERQGALLGGNAARAPLSTRVHMKHALYRMWSAHVSLPVTAVEVAIGDETK